MKFIVVLFPSMLNLSHFPPVLIFKLKRNVILLSRVLTSWKHLDLRGSEDTTVTRLERKKNRQMRSQNSTLWVGNFLLFFFEKV